ncbi:hypothetical protein BY458DRAFT_585402 [Sporodiniella umbellata]|nr:hypothetical protein BY458DRAFT_585402 [Sporodiniella umbellata]
MDPTCLFPTPSCLFQPSPQDILMDPDLLELFRILTQMMRQDPSTERIANLYFCMVYALGEVYPFYRSPESDCLVFRHQDTLGCVQLFDPWLPLISLDHISSSGSLDHISSSSASDDTQPLWPDRKRQRRHSPSSKKQKIPHRNGTFDSRRDDIISRMRGVMLNDLEHRLPLDYQLAIEKVPLPPHASTPTRIEDWLTPALRVLARHSGLKPHQDDGMNGNGIYYNTDYFRLYLAFVQFREVYHRLFPQETGDRNAHMKRYRAWIEPSLTETHWAAFRRNVMVGERMMQLAQVVGQGVLLITKELSGSKLHLTFTNHEWSEFIQGLAQGRWDASIDWSLEEHFLSSTGSRLLLELQYKFATHLWFSPHGQLVPAFERKIARQKQKLKHSA